MELYDEYFHNLRDRRTGWSKKAKRKFDNRLKKGVRDSSDLNEYLPVIKYSSNISKISLFLNLEEVICKSSVHERTKLYSYSNTSFPAEDINVEPSESDGSGLEIARIPKIVGAGLKCMIELIKESHKTDPKLCKRSLEALLDILQGQKPQGLKSEPKDVMNSLFNTLLDLTISYDRTARIADDGKHLNAIACSCLLSLAVGIGSTEKIIIAATSILMSYRPFQVQNMRLPLILTTLQKSVEAVLLGKMSCPDWITHGILIKSEIDIFIAIYSEVVGIVRSFATDGEFLYFYASKGLFKMGSGYNGTVKGYVYHKTADIFNDEEAWLGYANGFLWLKLCEKRGNELLRIDKSTLRVLEAREIYVMDSIPRIWFSDGDNLGVINVFNKDSIIVKMLNDKIKPANFSDEITVKFISKYVKTFGTASYEDVDMKTFSVGLEEEIASIVAGKEFALLRTLNGKVFYSGNGNSLGLKGVKPSNRWSELTIPQGAKVEHIAVGHEGLHGVIVTDDGAAFFCGTARRGEDGDTSKTRRQPKAVKPKRITKVENEFIVHAAANNGTTALVTQDGQLLMFGKDTAHCNASTGQVTELKGVRVKQVALGKAHAVALSEEGTVYTFGINNKGQCGREFADQVKETPSLVVGIECTGLEEEEFEPEETCSSGKHIFQYSQCLICTLCRSCTGHGNLCLSTKNSQKNPGQECGCGEGDSGCAICGCCRACATEEVDNSEMALLSSPGGDMVEMMRLDLMCGNENQEGQDAAKLQDQLQKRLEERRQKQTKKIVPKQYCDLKMKKSSARSSQNLSKVGSQSSSLRTPKFSSLINEDQPGGSDLEKDASRIVSLPPAPIILECSSPIVQIACGLHHTVILSRSGEVFTFGSNVHGQLGVGDILLRGGPIKVSIPEPAESIAAGSNHTVILTIKGKVFTFGSYQKEQLGRTGSEDRRAIAAGFRSRSFLHNDDWYAIPGPICGYGSHHKRKAVWIGAAGDQTFLRVYENLIDSLDLKHSKVLANKNSLIIIPNLSCHGIESLVINRVNGYYKIFAGSDQLCLKDSFVYLDPHYNVLWRYEPVSKTVSCHNIVATEAKYRKNLVSSMFHSSMTLPASTGILVKQSQVATYLLGTLEVLLETQHEEMELSSNNVEQLRSAKTYNLQDFYVVNRFEGNGGGWGYSAHSVEAIRFMADTDIILGGFGLFGGRGEYTAKIRLLDIGMDGGGHENNGEVIAEVEETPYECGPRQKVPIMFEEPVLLHAKRWYVAWAHISGPSSDCGSNGLSMIVTEDRVTFYFKSSKKANNGTDVNAGQIPQLFYRNVAQETVPLPRPVDPLEPVHILTKEFSSTVTKGCFKSLINLLKWSWTTLKKKCKNVPSLVYTKVNYGDHNRLNQLVLISRICLRLICHYVNEMYSVESTEKKIMLETDELADSIADIRALLREILSVKLTSESYQTYLDNVVAECHKTFRLIFHAMYPTHFLKWICLCELLLKIDKSGLDFTQHDVLLSAVVASLCAQPVHLLFAFPILDLSQWQLSFTENFELATSGVEHYFPGLIEKLTSRIIQEMDDETANSLGWLDVQQKLLDITIFPLQKALIQKPSNIKNDLVSYCCFLFNRLISELVLLPKRSDANFRASCGHMLHTTPSRFMRTNLTRTWNSGKGSPDAICFSVDRAGIVIAGVCVYGGAGIYEYELELLEDQSNTNSGSAPTQQWVTLEIIKGTFSPDDCVSDVAELKFDRVVPIREKVKYAIRLRNQGGRTSNGDGGLTSVRGPDGTTFTFFTCSLSFNGTTQTRGQIPSILYYSHPEDNNSQQATQAVIEKQARKSVMSIITAIINRGSSILSLAREKAEIMNVTKILSDSYFIKLMLRLIIVPTGILVTSDPRSNIQMINLIQEILPHITALNLLNVKENDDSQRTTTSNHYIWVESEHPYKPASVSNYRVCFPKSVSFMAIEFTPGCGTAQSEDVLKLFIPAHVKDTWSKYFCHEEDLYPTDLKLPYWHELHKLRGGSVWPQQSIFLPGNEILFSLETATDYLKDKKSCFYGFRCLVIGYNLLDRSSNNLCSLESELAFLGGKCAAYLIKKDLELPPAAVEEMKEDIEYAEEAALLVASEHPLLLMNGLALTHSPTVSQALDGTLPLRCCSMERLFLRDLVNCTPDSSGGRLACWLQPNSYVDPNKCEVLINEDELKYNCPAIITIITKDQYSEIVQAPGLKVEMNAVPIKESEADLSKKILEASDDGSTVYNTCNMNVPYETTTMENMCYHSITVMENYQNFCFEELRYMTPSRKAKETMLITPNNDGTYSTTWTPADSGWYSIIVTIDGYSFNKVCKVEAKQSLQDIPWPAPTFFKKETQKRTKMKKLIIKNSAGIRIRTHPTLQSEQIGVIPVGGTVAFLDEFRNDDGVWVRLDQDTLKQYSSTENNNRNEGWCMQYNHHFGKTFLHPLEEPKTIPTTNETNKTKCDVIQKAKSTTFHKLKIFTVVHCGMSSHNIRNRPSLDAPSIGVLLKGDKVEAVDEIVNMDGKWVKLSPEAKSLFCFEVEADEAWALAFSPTELYLSDTSTKIPSKRGYDFTSAGPSGRECSGFTFDSTNKTTDPSDPFIFSGDSSQELQVDNAVEVCPPWLIDDQYKEGSKMNRDDDRRYFRHKYSSRECESPGHYMKEFFKTREGKGCETTDLTPGSSPRLSSRSSSPKITGRGMRDSEHESSPLAMSPMWELELSSQGSSPVPIPGAESNLWHRRGSSQSDTSAHVSSLTRDPSPFTKDLPFSHSFSSLHSKPDESPIRKDFYNDEELVLKEGNADVTESSRVIPQLTIQTTQETTAMINKRHFNIGSGGKEGPTSPKPIRKDKGLIRNGNRMHSPVHSQNTPSSSNRRLKTDKKTVKEAISPSLAETFRAVFAAFLWQEGIVHDAMACASFLKFHPLMSKEGIPVVTRRASSPKTTTKEDLSREQKQLQRHSVEVSISGDYLHIQPSTLESLTRSAANATANRLRKKNQSQQQEGSIKEEIAADTIKDSTQNESANTMKIDENKKDENDRTISVLPLALKALVLIWDELSSFCCHAMDQQTSPASPSKTKEKVPSDMKNSDTVKEKFENKKKKEFKWTEDTEDSDEPAGQTEINKEEFCELCGNNSPFPITDHMKALHPGCGKSGMGKCYSAYGDHYFLNEDYCGENKVKDNTWYFLCDYCRIKYQSMKKNVTLKGKDGKKTLFTSASEIMENSSEELCHKSMDAHLVLKENAMFLLDLASSGMLNQQSRTVTEMPAVSEHCSSPEQSTPFPPLNSFQCLQSLGSHLQEQELNEILLRQTSRETDASFNGNPQPNAIPVSECQVNDNESQKGRFFHRSVSMGTSVTSWSKKEIENNKPVTARRRNNSSSGEINAEGESSLLCRPSAALQKLIPCLNESVIIHSQERTALDLQRKPSIVFILHRHPLKALRLAMNESLRKATCRLYAFQALNWLLRIVTQPVAIHDLLWWFVEALTPRQSNPFENEEPSIEQMKTEKTEKTETVNICQHPLSDITFAGDAAFPLWKAFHQFLQSVADLMLMLPPSSALQTMAVRCWGIKFSQIDHVFLHRSQVFNNISKILSRSEEETDEANTNIQESQDSECLDTIVEHLKDLTPFAKVKVSSRPAMIGSLTDNSTETFWESGDEDRNKIKVITIVCEGISSPEIICIHIDNSRDLANKVTSICFFSGCNAKELSRTDLLEIESRYTGWVSSPIPKNHKVLRLELKGPDNSLRVRQIQVLGHKEDRLTLPQQSAAKIQQSLCELETLRVFRLITSQVFGKLVLGESAKQMKREYEEQIEENNDLKEHMVGILFSGSKLTHLQKQICMHIVHAIRKETTRVREEWESFLSSPTLLHDIKPSDTYAFEMLSMVLALSGSSVGRKYLSHQYGLLTDLLSLLHTGSARVQRQVTSLLRRILPEISPSALGNVLGVSQLPPSDFSIASSGKDQNSSFDPHQIGILDVFLSVVAKVLNVQMKIKGKDQKEVTTLSLATSIHPEDPVGQRWWLRGGISRKLAEDIIVLLNEMAAGKLSESWANVTKGAIAENILNLTRLEENQREPADCLKTPTLWLALASLCVLDKDHVERLSAGQWGNAGRLSQSKPTCSNHDDDETYAVIQCSICGSLCADCDKYLHLHKRTRLHQRQVCKEEEEVIKVDLHEGCGRMKVFWIMALADSCTLKAMVEFRERSESKPSTVNVGICRFCGATGVSGSLARGNVCNNQDCQEHSQYACEKSHPCGHFCGGLCNESDCLPCLHGCEGAEKLKQDADDMCMICFTEALSYAPAVQLVCGHIFHFHCTRNILKKGWTGPRITFSFAQCPICKSPIEHPLLEELLQPITKLYQDVKRKALMRLKYEGLDKAVPIVSPGAKFYKDPSSYAMDRYAYYVCFKCKKAYYGGEARCDAEMNGEYDPSELVCGGCSDVARAEMCSKHGTDFLEYKCRYCCSVAVFFCFGTTHFCNSCHDDFQRITNVPKSELPCCPAGPKGKQLDGSECPLHVTHPPTGEEFALGCGVCRNAHTF